MPYIEQDKRKYYKKELEALCKKLRDSELCSTGELNYLITKLCLVYLSKWRLKYHNVNKIMGVLSCVSQEFYRRVAAPYEDRKARENGDIEEFSLT